jgi:predicted P-loop ATPase
VTARTFTSAADAALWYVEQGIYPVPVAYKGKNPKGNGWEQLRIDAASVPNYFNGQPQNIGALLGITATGAAGLTDVDLDSAEVLILAPEFLPATGFVFGRASKPASHWFYFCDPPVSGKKFSDPLNKSVLLELRGAKKNGAIGLQTVLPGSTHSSGELITFEDGRDSAPAVVTGDDCVDLEDAVSAIAAGALLARYWPASGRHDSMLALAGALARGGIPVAPALKFCRAVYAAVPTHTPEGIARIESEVSDSFDKVVAGEPATGFPSLTKHIDGKVVETAFEWLGLKAQPAPQIVAGADSADWRKELLVTDKGAIKSALKNAAVMLRHAPEWQGVLTFNEFSLYAETDQAAPWPQSRAGAVWTDDDDSHAAEWLQAAGVMVSSKIAGEAVQMIARERPYHPIKQYLAGLLWDQQPRIEGWLTAYLGAEDTPLNAAMGARWLIQGCARIMQPGCQADATLLLIGRQGIGKSSALCVLAGQKFFTDHLSDLGSKDSRQELHGRWIIELGEFVNRRSELERKGFLTARADCFRAPYERRPKWVPRTNVFAATSNDDAPLGDATGGRRYWSVTCGQIDIEKLKQDRGALWAEAYQRYLDGEPWHDDFPAFTAALDAEQSRRYAGGPYDDAILSWLRNPKSRPFNEHIDRGMLRFDSDPARVTIHDALVHGVNKAQHEINQRDRLIARDCLIWAGWKLKISKNETGITTKFYVREGTAE